MGGVLYQIQSVAGRANPVAVRNAEPLRLRMNGQSAEMFREAGIVIDPNLPSYSQEGVQQRYFRSVVNALEGKAEDWKLWRMDIHSGNIYFNFKRCPADDVSPSCSDLSRCTDLIYLVPIQSDLDIAAWGHITRCAMARVNSSRKKHTLTLTTSGIDRGTVTCVRATLPDGVRLCDTFRTTF